jgi:hypothetical protein
MIDSMAESRFRRVENTAGARAARRTEGIAHHLPLDGTVFKDSGSVDAELFVGTTSAGLTRGRGKLVLGLATTYTTMAFETQPRTRSTAH